MSSFLAILSWDLFRPAIYAYTMLDMILKAPVEFAGKTKPCQSSIEERCFRGTPFLKIPFESLNFIWRPLETLHSDTKLSCRKNLTLTTVLPSIYKY